MGPLVAEALAARFVDLDALIAEATGKSIPQIFADTGEPGFRSLERDEMRRVLAGEPCVVAAGGGWASQVGNLDAARARAFTVYLRVAVEVAAGRAAPTPDSRPLLAGGAVAPRIAELLAAREPFYARCDATVEAGEDPAKVADQVANLARSMGGWY